MKLIHRFKLSAITLTAVGTLMLGGISIVPVYAIENEGLQSNAPSQVDPQEATVELLEKISPELSEENLSTAAPEEIPVIAAYVHNLVEDAIVYMEQLTDVVSEEFQDMDMNEAIENWNLPADVEALLHLLIVKTIIEGEDVDTNALYTSSDHIDRAIGLLTETELNNGAGDIE